MKPPTNGGNVIPMPTPEPEEPMVSMYLIGTGPAATIARIVTGHIISDVTKYGAALRIGFETLKDPLIVMGCWAPSFADPIEVSPGNMEVNLVSKPTVAIGMGQFNMDLPDLWDADQYMIGKMVSGYSPGKSRIPAGPHNEAGEYPSAIFELNSGRFLIVTPFTMEVSENAHTTKPV